MVFQIHEKINCFCDENPSAYSFSDFVKVMSAVSRMGTASSSTSGGSGGVRARENCPRSHLRRADRAAEKGTVG